MRHRWGYDLRDTIDFKENHQEIRKSTCYKFISCLFAQQLCFANTINQDRNNMFTVESNIDIHDNLLCKYNYPVQINSLFNDKNN